MGADGEESGPASARPMTSAPREIDATIAAGPAPSRNGPASRARPPRSSRALWVGREMLRVTIQGWPTGPDVCETRHSRYRSARAPGPPRHPAGGARPLPVPQRAAAASVMAGEVRLGAGRRAGGQAGPARRPRRRARRRRAAADTCRAAASSSRNALDALGVDPAGRRCLDVGASTGGFTDCLLQAARRTSSRSTSPTASSTGRCARTRA